MTKWKILIPVLIVVIVGLIAYVQLTVSPNTNTTPPPANQTESEVDVSNRPLDVTGDEDIVDQTDSMVEEFITEFEDEESVIGDGTGELEAINSGENAQNILDVEYYEE